MNPTQQHHPKAATIGKSRYAYQSGFTLLEVLIAMLILAIGVLGVAALQIKGMQYNIDSGFRGNISAVSYDIIDRMRLNRRNSALYEEKLRVGFDVSGTAPTCNPTLANNVDNDINCWKVQLYNLLPQDAAIAMTLAAAANFREYIILYSWETRDGKSHSTTYAFKL